MVSATITGHIVFCCENYVEVKRLLITFALLMSPSACLESRMTHHLTSMKIPSCLTDKARMRECLKTSLKNVWDKTRLAVTLFLDKGLLQYAGALAFNTVLAIVPLVALFVAIARGFGYGSIVESAVQRMLASQPDAANYIIQFANSYLTNARSSAIIGFGVLVMLYSVIGLINNIETVFNNIWNVKQSRGITRRVMSYLSMFFLVPVTIVVVSGINLAVNSFISGSDFFGFLAPLLQLLIKLIPVAVVTLVFILVFVNVPNTRVKVRHAIVPALLAAIFMELLQRAYVYGQVFLSSYNAIYGSLAALPLFMLWVQFSWYIVLFFAMLCHTSQNLDYYTLCGSVDSISQNDRALISAAVVGLICRGFGEGKDHYTATMLQKETGIPLRLITESLERLCAVKILVEKLQPDLSEPTYAPFEDIANITLAKLHTKLGAYGKTLDYINMADKMDPEVVERINLIRDKFLSGLGEVKISDLLTREDNHS